MIYNIKYIIFRNYLLINISTNFLYFLNLLNLRISKSFITFLLLKCSFSLLPYEEKQNMKTSFS